MQKQEAVHIPDDLICRAAEHPLLGQLFLTKAGRYDHAFGHFIERGGIKDAILIFCLAGRGQLRIGGRQLQPVRGDLLLIPPDTAHFYGADPDMPWTILWLHFRSANMGEYLAETGFSAANPILHLDPDRPGSRFAVSSDLAGQLLGECLQELGLGISLPHQLLAAATLQQLLCRLIQHKRYLPNQPAGSLDMEAIMAYMQAHCGQNLTLGDLAAYCRMSKYHLIRLFKERSEYPPMEYLARIKIRQACELLDTTNYSIGEISQRLGYSTPYYFSAAFKQITGFSPRTFRKMISQRLGLSPGQESPKTE